MDKNNSNGLGNFGSGNFRKLIFITWISVFRGRFLKFDGSERTRIIRWAVFMALIMAVQAGYSQKFSNVTDRTSGLANSEDSFHAGLYAGVFSNSNTTHGAVRLGSNAESPDSRSLYSENPDCGLFKDAFNPLMDTVKLCGDSVILDAGLSMASYKWTGGATTQTLVVKKSGWYKVEVRNADGCIATDSSFVSIVYNRMYGSSFYCQNGMPREFRLWVDSTFTGTSGLKATALWKTGASTFMIQGPLIGSGFSTEVSISDGVTGCKASGYTYLSGSHVGDTIIANTDSVILRTPWKSNSIYSWSWINPSNYRQDTLVVKRSGNYLARFITAGQLCPNLAEYFVILVKVDIDKSDTTIYKGSSIQLEARYDTSGALIKDRHFLWSTGDTTSSITVKPARTTRYTVQVTVDGISRSDSVLVTVVDRPAFNPLTDSLKICGDSVVLDAGAGYSAYLWQNGSVTQRLTARKSGWFKVTATYPDGIKAVDSCFVSLVPASIRGFGYFCYSKTATYSYWIDSTFGNWPGLKRSILWSNGDTTYLRSGKTTAFNLILSATVSDRITTCRVIDTMEMLGKYPIDTLITSADSVTLKGWVRGLANYTVWQGSYLAGRIQQDSLVVRKSGNYFAMNISTSACGATRDYQVIMVNADILQKDTTICNSASLVLNARYDTTGALIKDHSFLWSTGEKTASITVKPTRTTKYYVTVTVMGVSRKDSVTISVAAAPSYNPLTDTTWSAVRPARLDAGTGFSKYMWNNGAATQVIHVTQGGKYKVSVTSTQGCVLSDSTVVQFPDTVGLVIPAMQGLCGYTVDVPVKAYGFRSMLTMQGSINWNPADLRFETIAGYGATALGLTAANFGVSQTADGKLAFSWNDPKASGLTIADTVTLFVIRFTPMGTSNRTVPITITGSPTVLEFYDAKFRRKAAVIRNGSLTLNCMVMVSGRITTPKGDPVTGVSLSMSGTEQKETVTLKDGYYALRVLPGNYILTPGKNNEQSRANGVSTLDLALIQSHILNSVQLNSPYKVIAADADGSGSVSTVDIVHIRRLILGMDSSLPGNRTWAFVDSGQVFANPLLPFPFVRSKTYTNLSVNVRQSFRAVKLGDVNWDRNPAIDQPLLKDSLKLYYEVRQEAGGIYVVQVKSRGIKELMGVQYTLNWDPHVMEYTGAGQNPLGMHFGASGLQEGALGMLWNDPYAKGVALEPGSLLFELRFHVSGNGVRPMVWLSSDKVVEEAFDDQYRTMGISLEGGAASPSIEFAVYPNPAGQTLHVQYGSDRQGDGDIVLLDMQGRIIYREVIRILPGSNVYRLNLSGRQPPKGIYTLRLTQGEQQRVTRVMIGYE